MFTPMQSMEIWLLGDRFLVNRYVVYDYDNCEPPQLTASPFFKPPQL